MIESTKMESNSVNVEREQNQYSIELHIPFEYRGNQNFIKKLRTWYRQAKGFLTEYLDKFNFDDAIRDISLEELRENASRLKDNLPPVLASIAIMFYACKQRGYELTKEQACKNIGHISDKVLKNSIQVLKKVRVDPSKDDVYGYFFEGGQNENSYSVIRPGSLCDLINICSNEEIPRGRGQFNREVPDVFKSIVLLLKEDFFTLPIGNKKAIFDYQDLVEDLTSILLTSTDKYGNIVKNVVDFYATRRENILGAYIALNENKTLKLPIPYHIHLTSETKEIKTAKSARKVIHRKVILRPRKTGLIESYMNSVVIIPTYLLSSYAGIYSATQETFREAFRTGIKEYLIWNRKKSIIGDSVYYKLLRLFSKPDLTKPLSYADIQRQVFTTRGKEYPIEKVKDVMEALVCSRLIKMENDLFTRNENFLNELNEKIKNCSIIPSDQPKDSR